MEPVSADVIVRRLYAALDGQDGSALTGVVDDAAVLHVAGSSGLAGDYQGREAIVGLMRRMAGLTDGSLRYGATRFGVSRAGHPMLLGRASGMRRGRRLDSDVEVIVRVDEGIVREAWLSFADQFAADRFWA